MSVWFGKPRRNAPLRPSGFCRHCTGDIPSPQDGDCNQFVILCTLPQFLSLSLQKYDKPPKIKEYLSALSKLSRRPQSSAASSYRQINNFITFCNYFEPRGTGAARRPFGAAPAVKDRRAALRAAGCARWHNPMLWFFCKVLHPPCRKNSPFTCMPGLPAPTASDSRFGCR